MSTYAVDFESVYHDTCSIGVSGTWNYLRHPDCDIYMVAIVGDDGTEWVGRPEDFDWYSIARPDATWIAHNYSFDAAVYTRLIELGKVPDIWPGHWFCSADAAAYHGLPRNLKGAIEAKFKGILEVSKDTRNAMKGQRWEDMSPEFQKEVSDYALHDSRCCLALWKALEPTFPWHERMISQHTAWMGWEGLPVNRDKIEDGIQILKDQMWEAEQNIPWAGTEKLLSPKALADECRKVGINPPRSLAQDSEECEAWLEEHGGTYPWIGAMRTWRRCNALLKKLEAMLSRVRPDGVMGFGMKFFGAHTGRDSGDAGFNCVSGDHEVLTPEGWVPIESWREDLAPIMQWSEPGKLEFVRAGKVTHRYTGTMIRTDNVKVRILATPDHRVICRNYKGVLMERPARELLSTRVSKIPTNGIFDTSPAAYSDDQLRLLVATAADGHDHPKGPVTFGFKKARKIERLRSILLALGIPSGEKLRPNGVTNFFIKKSERPEWLTKGFGPWLLNLSQRQAELVIDELRHWDGTSHQRSGALIFCTTLEDQAAWIATLAHIHGRSVSMNKYKHRWDVYFKNRGSESDLRREQSSEEPFSGFVYCPQVPSGMFLVRYKNRIHVTGNCQNLPRGELFGVNLREMIEAPQGKTFVIVDLAQIEPRCLFSLAGDTRMLDAIRAGYGIYEAFAVGANMWNGPAGTLKKTDPTLYQTAKAACLGCGFGMSGNKFHLTAPALTGGAYAPTLAEAEAVVQRYRQSYKSVTGLWDKLDKAMRRHVGKDFLVELPSGRLLRYGAVQNYGGLSAIIMRMGKLTRCKFWHGTLTENLVQATARDVFMDCTLRTLRAGYDVLLRVHDEIVCLVDEDLADTALAEIVQIFSTPPEWMPGLPIAAEGITSKVYTK